MALLQGTKKLFSPLLNDLDCVSAVKEAINILAFFVLTVVINEQILWSLK